MTRALPLIGLIILCACGSPTQPIVDFGKGVTIYTDSLYRGDHVTLSGNVFDFRDLTGPCNSDSGPYSYSPGNFDDCVSSLRIPDGWTAVVYRDRDIKGDTATYTADVPSPVNAGTVRDGASKRPSRNAKTLSYTLPPIVSVEQCNARDLNRKCSGGP